MPNNIIKHHNDPRSAYTLKGDRVERTEQIFLPSDKQWYPVLQTSMHFCFRDPSNPRGTTLFCTCGSAAGVFGYEAYRHWSSFIGNEVIGCISFLQYKRHADGSHE